MKSKTSSLTIKNYQIRDLADHIIKTPYSPDLARSRNRVADIIVPKVKLFKAAHDDLLQRYGKKDKAGNLERTPDGKGVHLDDPVEYQNQYSLLLEEEIVLDVLPSNIVDFKRVPEMLKKTTKELDYLATQTFEELLTIFTSLK